MSPRASARTTTTGAPPHPVDEILPARRLVPAALQHVAGMYAGLTAPPLIIGGALGLSPGQLSTLIAAAFLVAGIGTAAQALGVFGVGARLPLTNGVSFAVVSPVLATVAADGRDGALPAVFGATLVAGVLCLLLAPAFCRLVRFFPPVVSGCVITLVGISLLPVASVWARGGDPRAADYAAPSNLALAAATLAITLAIHRMVSGRFLGRIAVLLGMFAGTLLAVPLGKVDLDPLTQAPLFALPEPFAFGAPRFVPTVIATAVVVMLVSMMESTASLLALAAVTGRPAQDRTIAGSLRAQGLATALGGVLGAFTSTAYAQNVGLVALSRIRSRYVVALCGAVLVLMGLVPVLGSLVALVPMPVLGGAGVVFFGSVAVAGIRTLAKASLGTGHNAVTVSVTLAFGLFPLVSPGFYDRLPDPAATILESGVTAGCLVAVLLNYLLNHLGRGTEADPDTVTAEQIRGLDGAGGTRGTPHPGTAGVPFLHAAAGSPPPLPHRTPTGPPAAPDRHPYATATGSPDAAPPAPGTYDAAPPAPGTHDAAAPAPGTHDAAVHTSVSPAPAEAATSTGVTFPGPLHPLHDRSRRPHPQRDRTPAPAPYPQPPDPAAPASGQPW
ncbi:solute carrier family 23 protein [Streptomyces sp. NPDC059708]|uniref:nucleobase:cation symporter-2 family protein n=1 Tax=Streptomyces sp. NPDC059708 TaxID=3346916 RepID=UPI00367B6590